ncbi:hypothetical protein QWZ06_04815 [Chryseobacterium tructae]|uniref:Uncharacterized protein n=1 Tax=Chryseobacterium tructae TaxID=1037380 RepID=A0ABV7XVW0_9FLAO|nr:hypothetical protein [Chryseobacterium tructae]MDN3691620.1 hypothetical protein [Chryseobacterium tructae]
MKQQKEILSNKMKKLILILFAISLQSCNGQDKDKANTATQKKEIKSIVESSINFLDKKYQDQGFTIPDSPNPYPTYSFLSKKVGSFTVDYIGKTDNIQYFWNVDNTNGYFSKYSSPEDAAYKSDDIKKLINNKDYYIIASYLPNKYISYLGGEDGEFDLKPGAITSFYLYENNKWKLIGEAKTAKISENLLAFKTSLIQREWFRNIGNLTQNYDGSHSVSVDTEATTTGMASISYNFIIKKNNIHLSLTTYHESNLCEGKYFALEKNNQLEIYYFDNELSCISIDPKFYIKKENEKFYIKSVGGEGTYNKWILMH